MPDIFGCDCLEEFKDLTGYTFRGMVCPEDRARLMEDGSQRYFRIEFARLRMPGGRMGVVCGFKDVDAETRKTLAESRALRDALAAAEQASRAKSAFLSNMSHEIRTPMNAIIGLNNISLNDPQLTPRLREHLEKIGSSARHLLEIINEILDMSRIESGRMVIHNEEFSFSKTLEQVNTIISGQCREKGLQYECHTKGRIDDCYVRDDMKLRQVLINILGNAVKFTPTGGSVSFTVEEAARFDGKATLRFIVSDTGIGISKELLPHLLDAFTQEDSSSTAKCGSTGLGLPITKSLVDLMNGTIQVESEKDAGTTVTVTLAECRHASREAEENVILPREMSVLVIDDDPIACEHARIVLGKVGVKCDTAQSGEDGLQKVKLRHARQDAYDLILIDWKMPGMNGVETTQAIRDIVGRESAIIMTSYNWDDIAGEAKNAGVDSFAPKPLFAATVMDEFREAFRRRGSIEPAAVDLKGRRVLVAEDVAINAEILLMVLEMREIEADIAENGRIAVERFAASEPGCYDAILMDMRMPEMDGLEATRTIRAMDRPDAGTIPIIALTGNAFDEDVQRSMQAGLNAHLSKPVQPVELFKAPEKLIGG